MKLRITVDLFWPSNRERRRQLLEATSWFVARRLLSSTTAEARRDSLTFLTGAAGTVMLATGSETQGIGDGRATNAAAALRSAR
jgi:hypothetical protein